MKILFDFLMSGRSRKRVSATPAKRRDSEIPTPRTPRVYYYNAEPNSPNEEKQLIEEEILPSPKGPNHISSSQLPLSPIVKLPGNDWNSSEKAHKSSNSNPWNYVQWIGAVVLWSSTAAVVRGDLRLLTLRPHPLWALLGLLSLLSVVFLAPSKDPTLPMDVPSFPSTVQLDTSVREQFDEILKRLLVVERDLESTLRTVGTVEGEVKGLRDSEAALQGSLSHLRDSLSPPDRLVAQVTTLQDSLADLRQQVSHWEEFHQQVSHWEELLKEVSHREPPSPAEGFPSPTDLQQHLLRLDEALAAVQTQLSTLQSSEGTVTGGGEGLNVVVEKVRNSIAGEWVHLPDWALRSAGAEVVPEQTSPSYERPPSPSSQGWRQYFSRRPAPIQPSAALQESMAPGNCWAFPGKAGNLTVRLPQPVNVTSVTLQHISPDIAYNIESAPKSFRVVGRTEKEEVFTTQDYHFDPNKSTLTTFPLSPAFNAAVTFVTLEITDNHGHPDYTCLYRFRVHSAKK